MLTPNIKFTLIILLFSSPIFPQWTLQNYDTNYVFVDIDFINDNTGIAVGFHYTNPYTYKGAIYKTTNAGLNWNIVFIDTNFIIYTIHFINSTDWLAAGGLYSTQPKMLKTTNSGNNWFYINTGEITSRIHSIVFFNNVSYVTGAYGIYKSTNGGLNWTRLLMAGGDYANGYFLNALTGWSAFDDGIYKTSNGGVNWIRYIYNAYAHQITFTNQNTGYVIYDSLLYPPYYTKIFKTTNAGDNWILLNTWQKRHFWSLDFINENTGFVVGNEGIILKTTNAGNSWFESMPAGQIYNLIHVNFLNANTGYTCGSKGVILKTTNGGVFGITPISNEVPSKFSLSQNYPNPFNPRTVIKFQVASSSSIKIIVFDILGREVQTLVNEQLKPGTYEVDFVGSNFASGIYFYKLEAGEYVETRKMVLMK